MTGLSYTHSILVLINVGRRILIYPPTCGENYSALPGCPREYLSVGVKDAVNQVSETSLSQDNSLLCARVVIKGAIFSQLWDRLSQHSTRRSRISTRNGPQGSGELESESSHPPRRDSGV